ncbi:MAG TPA: aminoacyl-tRNA deacylase [Aggregatilineales bacterium]|nr:aminoacyl-tRNA deacylase [Aggregatilineales bacterium]
MATKLNSMRLLEANKIPYEVITFDDSIHDAVEVAHAVGIAPHEVYKTLVVERSGTSKPILVMVPADRQLDLKKLAAGIGEKKVNMASHADAEKLTGLKVGGIGALALVQKHWEAYLDQSARALERIYVSAGQRGINLHVPVAHLMRLVGAQWIDATVDEA